MMHHATVRLAAALLIMLPCAGCAPASAKPDTAAERAIGQGSPTRHKSLRFIQGCRSVAPPLSRAVIHTCRERLGNQQLELSRVVCEPGAPDCVSRLHELAFPRTEIRQMGNVAVVFSSFEVVTTMHGVASTMAGPFWHLGS